MSKLLFFFFLFTFQFVFSQDTVESVVIKKTATFLYRGTQKETTNWYLLIDTDNSYYLAKVDRPVDEVFDWFTRFKNSQNIYKSSPATTSSNGGFGTNNQYVTLHFRKEDEPGEILNFYIEKPDKNTIVLISMDDNTTFALTLVQQ